MQIAVDTETTGLTPHHGCEAFMLQVCDGKENHWWTGHVNPYDRTDITWDKSDLLEFLEIFEEADSYLFHNAKFDIRMIFRLLKKYGLEKGFLKEVFRKFECTMLACHAVQSGFSVGLKENSFLYLDYYNDNQQELKKRIMSARSSAPKGYDLGKLGHPTFGGTKKTKWYATDYWLDIEACTAYGLDDVEMTYLLWNFLKEGMEAEGLMKPYQVRKKLLEVFYHIEDIGMNMYTERVEQEVAQLEEKCQKLHDKIAEDNNYQSNLNLDTRDGLLFLVHSKLGIHSDYTTPSGQASMKKEAIDYYIETYPEVETLQDLKLYRKSKTQISDIKSYADWVCPDGRLHASYWITGTRETRQAVEMPNIQNIGKGIRHLMGPPPGRVWLQYDLVNIEMRRWVYFVGNKELIDVFESGGSVHLLIAETLYPKEYAEHGKKFKDVFKDSYYQWVKNGNFAIIYGATEAKADVTYHRPGAYRRIIERFPEVQKFTDRCAEEVWYNYNMYNQPCVTVDGGYRLDVPLDEIYKGTNYKVQGCAGWIMGEAMIEVYNEPEYKRISKPHGCGMVDQVHDSLDIEILREHLSVDLILTFKTAIERAGLRYMPTNEASCDILCHYNEPEITFENNQLIEAPL